MLVGEGPADMRLRTYEVRSDVGAKETQREREEVHGPLLGGHLMNIVRHSTIDERLELRGVDDLAIVGLYLYEILSVAEG